MSSMQKLLAPVFALLFTLTAGATTAQAQQGTFCSGAASDGIWALAYSNNPIFYNCATMRDAIRWVTRAPIVRNMRGYYWLYAVNFVQVSCYGGNASFSGVGDVPLANAFNYARYHNAQGCIFGVN